MTEEKATRDYLNEPVAPVTKLLDDTTFDDSEMDFGVENSSKSLSQYPLIKLMQALSPEVQDRTMPNIYAGIMIDDATKEPLGEKVIIRVMRTWRSRVKFPPREDGNSSIECACPTFNAPGECGSTYGRCDSCEYNNFDVRDRCLTQYQIVAALGDNPYNLYRIILSKTSYRAGGALDRALKALGSKYRGKPVYMFKVELSVEEATNPKIGAKYFVYNLKVLPPTPGEDLLPPDLEAEFKDAFLEVKALREDAIRYHNEQLANKANEESPVAGALGNNMESMGSELFNEFASGEALATEEVPF